MKYCDCDYGKCFGGPIDACVFEFCRKSSAPPTGSAAHLEILETLAQAASDYKLAYQNQEFAELNGGVETMRRNLFTAVIHYERSVDDENERG